MVRPSLKVMVFLIGLISEFTICEIFYSLKVGAKIHLIIYAVRSVVAVFDKNRLIFTAFRVLFEFIAIFAPIISHRLHAEMMNIQARLRVNLL
jgi:hypothetical protein